MFLILGMQDFDFCPKQIKFYPNLTQFIQICLNFTKICPNLIQIFLNFVHIVLKIFARRCSRMRCGHPHFLVVGHGGEVNFSRFCADDGP